MNFFDRLIEWFFLRLAPKPKKIIPIQHNTTDEDLFDKAIKEKSDIVHAYVPVVSFFYDEKLRHFFKITNMTDFVRIPEGSDLLPYHLDMQHALQGAMDKLIEMGGGEIRVMGRRGSRDDLVEMVRTPIEVMH